MFPGLRYLAIWLLSSTLFMACSTDPTRPVPAPVVPTPVADSPAHAVDVFQWALENRSFDTYHKLFTDDYRFAFAVTDTNGNAFRTTPWERENELVSFSHMVSGGGTQSPASTITAVLGKPVIVDDPRPGMADPERRKQATFLCNLTVQSTDGTAWNIHGKLQLFLVRGDLAIIPSDLGRTPDAGIWYIERWEDLTLMPMSGLITAAQPSSAYSWGWLKALYLPSAATASRP